MLWGNGDSSRLNDEEQSTLGQLRRMVETGHIVALNPKQSELVIEALDWYGDWKGTFRTLKHVRNVLGLLTFFFVSWWFTGGDIQTFIGLFK